MSYTAIDAENALRNWAQMITGCPFYFRYSNVGRPSGLYGNIRFMGCGTLGTPNQVFTPETVAGEPMVKNELNDKTVATFSFNIYRAGARDILSRLQQGNWLTLPNEILQNANIGFVRFSTWLDLSEVIDGNFEERAQFDATFNLVGYASEDLNTIATVPIDNVSYNIQSEVSV